MPLKHVKFKEFCQIVSFFMPVFPILRSKVYILRRFLNFFCSRASARLQPLKALSLTGVFGYMF